MKAVARISRGPSPSRWALVPTAIAILVGCSDAGTPPAERPGAYASRLVEITNEVRGSRGLEPLTTSPCAQVAARVRAASLVGSELEHTPLQDVAEDCAPGARIAENLVDSPSDPRDVVDAWMNSPGHRNNIVDPNLGHVGIGCVESTKGMLCSQIFLGQE